MKISITLSEAKNLIAAQLGINYPFTLEIADIPLLNNKVQELLNVMKEFFTANGEILPPHKIAAIKKLREYFVNPAFDPNFCDSRRYLLGLVHAKTTVENWPQFVANITQTNRMPTPASGKWLF